MICLCLTAGDIAGNLQIVERYRGQFDLLELRADLLRRCRAPTIRRAARLVARCARQRGHASLPIILTIRRARDGGAYSGPEHRRKRLLRRALLRRPAVGGFAYVDLEDDLCLQAEGMRLARRARARGIEIIRSQHDLQGGVVEAEATLAAPVA